MPLVVTTETDRVLCEVRTEAKGTIKDIKIPRFTRQLQQTGYCNCLLDVEFPASVTTKAASGSRGSCSGTMQRVLLCLMRYGVFLESRTNTCYLCMITPGSPADFR